MNDVLTMADVRERTGISDHTLRYYEKAGLLKGVGRHRNGHRYYTEDDLQWLRILQILRGTGMPIRNILQLAAMVEAGDASIEQRIAYFRDYQRELRAQIEMRETAIRTLDEKIARHQAKLPRRARNARQKTE